MNETLIDMYYLLWFIPLCLEIYSFDKPGMILNMRMINPHDIVDVIKKYFILFSAIVIEFILVFIGLFSSQWIFSILLIVVGLVFKGKRTSSALTNSVLCQLLIVLLLANKFYFHINFLHIL